MALRASFPSDELKRAGFLAGAFFSLAAFAGSAMSLTSSESGEASANASLLGPIAGPARIIDGDTIDVANVRIRLEGIDAPEISQTCETATGETWPCGLQAAAALRAMARDNDFMCDRNGLDVYGRTLATCYEGGINVNEALVRSGFARAFVRYSKEFVNVEAEARSEKIGIWQGRAEAPWDYRHHEWQTAAQVAPSGCAIKGNVSANGRIYHMPWDPWYDRIKIDATRGKRWFCSETDAVAAGWRPAAHY